MNWFKSSLVVAGGAVAVVTFVATLTATAARASAPAPECACGHPHGEHGHASPSNSFCQFGCGSGQWTGETRMVNARIYKVVKCIQGHRWLEE